MKTELEMGRTCFQGASAWPEELRLRDQGRLLRVRFDDGSVYDLSAEYLRVQSPSAELRGHGGDTGGRIIGGKADVAISGMETMGNYAVRLLFDDGHASGIYTWSYLYTLGVERKRRWKDYLAALDELGLSRDV